MTQKYLKTTLIVLSLLNQCEVHYSHLKFPTENAGPKIRQRDVMDGQNVNILVVLLVGLRGNIRLAGKMVIILRTQSAIAISR